jgi:hypothetical protein
VALEAIANCIDQFVSISLIQRKILLCMGKGIKTAYAFAAAG